MATDTLPAHVRGAIAADPHRPGTVDRLLLDRQVFLTRSDHERLYQPPARSVPPPAGSRPWLEQVVAEQTRDALHPVQRATALRRWVAATPARFPEGTAATRGGAWGDFSSFRCGGPEEEIVRKGSPLAVELCRVLVTLARIADLEARIAFLYADAPPVRHAVVEVFLGNRWSVFDPVSDRCVTWPKHGYAGAREIQQLPRLADGLPDHARLPYLAGRFYRTIGIADYDPWEPGLDFSEGPLDDATRARLLAGEAG